MTIDIPPEERRDEQLGSKPKFWFVDPNHKKWLFKRGRDNEDWSEKVAEALAGHLGLPHAEVELAVCEGKPGIVSPSFLEPGDRLVHGNELLVKLDTSYPVDGRFHISEHTAEAVFTALKQSQVKTWSHCPHALPESFDGYDLFLGYLLFDAWIGNSDRHHENWAVVQRGEQRMLSPTYDHGSSMGRNETEPRAMLRLEGKDPRVTIDSYASKCFSALFHPSSPQKAMPTLDAFFYASQERPLALGYWLDRLKSTTEEFVRMAFQSIPDDRITMTHRRFAHALIKHNRGRLLAAQAGSNT
ncbi:HipA-like protein [Corallococcus sp. AB004]|nr:HipA-like protein [Corallococcus sp. AB004]